MNLIAAVWSGTCLSACHPWSAPCPLCQSTTFPDSVPVIACAAGLGLNTSRLVVHGECRRMMRWGATWSSRSGTNAETVRTTGWPRLTAAGNTSRGVQSRPIITFQKPTDWPPVEAIVQMPVAAHCAQMCV